MLWIAESMEKFWQAYKEGLQLACPVHREASAHLDDVHSLDALIRDDAFRAEVSQRAFRSFH